MCPDTDSQEVRRLRRASTVPVRPAAGDRAFTALRIPAGRRAGLHTSNPTQGRPRKTKPISAEADREIGVPRRGQTCGTKPISGRIGQDGSGGWGRRQLYKRTQFPAGGTGTGNRAKRTQFGRSGREAGGVHEPTKPIRRPATGATPMPRFLCETKPIGEESQVLSAKCQDGQRLGPDFRLYTLHFTLGVCIWHVARGGLDFWPKNADFAFWPRKRGVQNWADGDEGNRTLIPAMRPPCAPVTPRPRSTENRCYSTGWGPFVKRCLTGLGKIS